jgi:predicted dienelactone hydrolase
MFRFSFAVGSLVAVILSANVWAQDSYDPLRLEADAKVRSIELTVDDEARGREIPLRVCLPADSKLAPVVIYSHGLGGSRNGSRFLGEHLAARGYVVVYIQHPGSDESVWKNARLFNRMSEMKKAASAENLKLRCEDVKSLIDQLERWNKASEHPLANRIALEHIGMSGHSFGAHTTQAVAGQSFPLLGLKFVDPRIDAAIAYSPSSPPIGNKKAIFGQVKVPWLLMTGTQDVSPIGDQDVESRTAVYTNLTNEIDKYEIVLYGAEHAVFTDVGTRSGDRNSVENHHRSILALTTAFWDSYLKQNEQAKKWLTGDEVKAVIDEDDRWQLSLAK